MAEFESTPEKITYDVLFAPSSLNAFGDNYYAEGLRAIDNLLKPRLERKNVPPLTRDFIQQQVMSAHLTRCNLNHESLTALPTDCRMSEDLQTYLALDVPTTAQALEVFNTIPDLSSIEIAKLTHPYDWEIANAMDCFVKKSLRETYGDAVYFPERSDAYTKLKLLNVAVENDKPTTAILERKRDFAYIDGVQPVIVVKPFVYLVDLFDLTQQSVRDGGIGGSLCRAIMGASQLNTVESNNDGPIELKTKLLRIERLLKPFFDLEPHERPSWLQPITTSYYAFRIPLEQPKP